MKTYPDIIQLYEEKSDYWSEKRSASTFFEKKYLDWVMAMTPPKSEILDLGCGNGWPIANFFIERGYRVTGVDGAPKMVAKARKRFPNAEWIVSDMRKLSLKRRFQAVIAWDSFFHLTRDHQRTMFEVFTKHLNPEGCLLFTSGSENGEAIGEMDGSPLYHSSLSPNEYRELFRQNGLREFDYTSEDKECGRHSVWRCLRDKVF